MCVDTVISEFTRNTQSIIAAEIHTHIQQKVRYTSVQTHAEMVCYTFISKHSQSCRYTGAHRTLRHTHTHTICRDHGADTHPQSQGPNPKLGVRKVTS